MFVSISLMVCRDSKQVLDEQHFDEDDGVNAGLPLSREYRPFTKS